MVGRDKLGGDRKGNWWEAQDRAVTLETQSQSRGSSLNTGLSSKGALNLCD